MSTFLNNKLIVKTADWNSDSSSLRKIREEVFVAEQAVPIELEWDDEDASATHFLAIAHTGQAVGCARLLTYGQIGRMAVLKPFRGQHVGEQLLKAAIAAAKKQNFSQVWLHAQVHALPFYEKYGFIAEGDIFDDAGIPHRHMRRDL